MAEHVVTQPRTPFRTRDGALEIHQVPAWSDNLIWLAVCLETGAAAAVDGPEAPPLLRYCAEQGIELTQILNTHTHGDHIGLNRDLERMGLLQDLFVTGPEKRAPDVPGINRGVCEGDTVRIGQAAGQVMLTEGHINGHISYVFSDVLFCGDTLFTGGCGYLFDGPPATMQKSLQRLGQLDPNTRVCCAHEYTEDNLRFAWSVEPSNAALAERIRAVWALRARGECAVPSTIGEELATNPFLRWDSSALVAAVAAAMPKVPLDTPAQIFAATRALKDLRHYRGQPDTSLPL